MDQVTLVERRVDDGQALILQLGRDGFPVTVALWLRPSDENWWHLYIAAKLLSEQGPTAAYRKVQAALRQLPGTSVSLADVKLIEPSNPVAIGALKIRKRYGGTAPIRLGGVRVGPILVDEGVMYPPIRLESPEQYHLGKVRLKDSVHQKMRVEEIIAPFSTEENNAMAQLMASGMNRAEAEQWVRRRREIDKAGQDIPAGTVVDATITAWWGNRPDDDPNPLLRVVTDNGAEGLTFLNNTEPVS
jgi:hypothetical protein